ncbi:MAG: hypothetical protein OSB34_14750 [Planktomarina sp.]|nr:hypothetical protein [Planktomarina sp.]
MAKGHDIGRGVFYRANNAPALPNDMDTKWVGKNKLSVPFEVPFSLFNNMSISMFNKYYFHSNAAEMVAKRVHYQTFFYPLDRLLKWNLVYGKRGFLQYQCVVPKTNEREAIKEILQIISAEGAGSFLAVLKQFGDLESPGILSFPRPGTTLALDFPNNGAPTFKLLRYLDEVVKAANGAIYPAKDARMDVDTFRQSFPQWESIMPFVDPYFSSSFWRRINGHNV